MWRDMLTRGHACNMGGALVELWIMGWGRVDAVLLLEPTLTRMLEQCWKGFEVLHDMHVDDTDGYVRDIHIRA